MSQRSFASTECALKKKQTRREKFLAEMDRIVPWTRLMAVIEPLYPKRGRVGRRPIGIPSFGCTAASSGTAWLTKRWRMRCTTAERCENF